MVSKNNQHYRQQQLAKQCQHYGLRKFSFGLASVLLGTTLYFGSNEAVAKAAVTPTDNNNEVQQTKGQQAPLQSQKEVTLKADPASTQNNNSSIGQDTLQESTGEEKMTPVRPHADSSSNEAHQDWVLQSDHDTLSLNQPTVSLTWQISNFKKGDVYSLHIPQGDLYQNNGVSVNPLPAGLGTSRLTKNEDGSYTITNTFTSNATTGGISQGITIAAKPNSKIIENGKIAKVLTMEKNGESIGSYSIYEDIEPTMSISTFKRMNPTPDNQKQILVNQDYSYSADVTVPFRDAVYHYGKVDLTLNVPSNFQINIAQTMQQFMNTNRDDGYSKVESISQASAGAPVIFKGLQIGNDHSLTIVGQFKMASPTEDQTLMAKASNAVWTLNGGKQIQVAVPTWGDTILGNETQLPDGNLFTGEVTNAYPRKANADYSYQDTVPLSSPVDIGTGSYDTDHYINRIEINNPSAYNFNNIHYAATFSDGYSVDKLTFNGDPSWPTELRGHTFVLPGRIKVTYQDGSSEVVEESNNTYEINPNKNLAKVEWIDGLASGKSAWLYVSGRVAAKKENGQPMQVGDKLTASITLTSDPAKPEFTETSPIGWSKTQTVVQRVTTPWTFQLSNEQDEYNAGSTRVGYFNVQIPQGLDNADLVNPHIYYVLPTTIKLNLNRFKGQYYSAGANNRDESIPFKVSAYHVNGRTVVEYDGTGLTIPGYTAINNYFNWYDLRNDLPNMSSDGYVFVSADGLQVKSTNNNPLATADQLAMLKDADANHTFQVGKFTVAVESATGLAIVENAQGNTDNGLTQSGHSDDKGSTQMTFTTGMVYNPKEDSTIHNVVVVATLPKDNTATSFNFNLNKNGATVVSAITGEALPVGSYEILYSTQPGKTSNEKTDLSSYVTGDKVSDWSKIKSVALKINALSKENGSIRLVLQGEDPTVTTDAGKTAYLATQVWSDEHLPMAVVAGENGSSSVHVDGQSTVKARLHYRDAQGKDHYIALGDLTHQYKDNQDTMKSTDFALSADDQEQIPAGYHLNPTPTIINGAKTWQTNDQNGSAAFNQVVKYYFDGDIVQFELSNQAAAQLKYYDDTTHQFISGVDPTKVKGNVNTAISFTPTTLNSLTDRYDYVGISKGDEKSTVDTTTFDQYQFGNYDNDDSTTQTFVVHLKHGVKPVDEQHPSPVDPQDPTKGNIVTSKTVSRTITYKFSDGSTHKAEIPTNPVTQSTTFTGTGHVDKVTGKIVDIDGQGNITKTYSNPNDGIHWVATGQTTDNGILDKKNSPSVVGYTPDKLSVKEVTVHHNTNDLQTVVTYTPDKQVAQLTFYDDTTGRVIPGKQDQSTGVTNGTINFANGSGLLKSLTDHGYEFVKVVDNTNQQYPQDLTGSQYTQVAFPNFDHDDQVIQQFVVHVKHGTKSVTDKKAVHETIHYRYEDGTIAAVDHQATPIEFKRTGTEDLVSNKPTWNPWTPSDSSFIAVDSPIIQGYHADQPTVAKQDVTAVSDDVDITVTYHPDKQAARLTFYDDTTHQVIKGVADHADGVTDGHIQFKQGSQLVQQLQNHGYKFVKVVNNTDNKKPVDIDGDSYAAVTFPNFDHDNQVDQSFVVHLEHATKSVTDKRVVHETIHYRYANGTPVTSDYQATPIEFQRTGVEDLVTKGVQWDPWTPVNGNFAEVQSPSIPGYHADTPTVAEQQVTPDSNNLDITVTYAIDPQPGYIHQGNDIRKTNGSNALGTIASEPTDGRKKNTQLPQTGERQSGLLVSLGLASLLALLGLTNWRRHQD